MSEEIERLQQMLDRRIDELIKLHDAHKAIQSQLAEAQREIALFTKEVELRSQIQNELLEVAEVHLDDTFDKINKVRTLVKARQALKAGGGENGPA